MFAIGGGQTVRGFGSVLSLRGEHLKAEAAMALTMVRELTPLGGRPARTWLVRRRGRRQRASDSTPLSGNHVRVLKEAA